ncbi:3-oxoacyl-ACP reductase FabG [Candidatus Poribacteria bacterium]|nr:3-oxoacyl-ACP reductase FabG [Candidatus Poribacteria bacterium]MYA68666.1 3-oxoacyl-ACP reductase FabG [Candidatus Poribacteria bacterium]MYH82763.1 3-oxoacyl-ACP reductase FabG [Candidatus Poribacteria bacterium]MYK96323.1 3-oxoacyl-ACP reductase FabG [Candidatus Poribacteria bacterium]
MDVLTEQNAFRADLLNGKTAIVTGASRGIGAAIAGKLCEGGANVVLCSRSAESVAQIADTLRGKGYSTYGMAADISEKADVEVLIEKTLDRFSHIDILVNNAGITRDMLLMRLKDEDWDAVLQTNLTGTMYCTRAVLRPMLRQRSGRIINISSVVGLVGNPGQANYAAAKAGIIGFTKATAKEVGARGITVNAIAPGFITTDMTAAISEEHQKQLLELIPLREFGHPGDVADAVCFLASDAARYITGQTLQVDGGMVM